MKNRAEHVELRKVHDALFEIPRRPHQRLVRFVAGRRFDIRKLECQPCHDRLDRRHCGPRLANASKQTLHGSNITGGGRTGGRPGKHKETADLLGQLTRAASPIIGDL